MKKYQTTLLAGVAALALVAGTSLASAQQSKEHMGGSQAGSPQAGQSMNKGSQPQAQEKGKATQTQAQEKGKANADRTAQTGKENMNPGGQESQKGKRGARNENGAKGNRQAERQNTLKGLRGDTSKPMQGENEKQEGSKKSTSKSTEKGNTSNQAQQQSPQNNMQRGTQNTQRGTEGTQQRGTESTQRGTEGTQQRGTESNQGSAEVRGGGTAGGGARTAQGVNVQLNEQQRTEIRTTVIEGRNAPRVSHVDFDVRVGTAVPRGKIHVVPVPETLVRIEPRWRGFMYFVYEEEIVVVDPHDYKIIAVLPV